MVGEARVVFDCLGFEYHCCDIDERDGTVYLDFNALPNVSEYFGQFDFVANSGTTEHVLNSSSAFFYMHSFAKVGGVLCSYVPLFGLGNHGIVNHTPKFWHTLHWMNRYDFVEGRVDSVDEQNLGVENVFGDHLDKFDGLREVVGISYMIHAVFQKTLDTVFIPPSDPVIVAEDDGRALGKTVAGSLRPFVLAGVLDGKTALKGVNSFLEYNAKPFQYSKSDQRRLFGGGWFSSISGS